MYAIADKHNMSAESTIYVNEETKNAVVNKHCTLSQELKLPAHSFLITFITFINPNRY